MPYQPENVKYFTQFILLLQTGSEFEYVDVWSSRFSWGGLDPPEEGDMVVIPADMTILLDVTTPVLSMLLIQGEMVTGEAHKYSLLQLY